jgi:hypothetical protein
MALSKKLPLYQIVDWPEHFENAKSKTFNRCQNLMCPNKHGGTGWSNVMGEHDGAMIWGIWKMILEMCSRQPKPRAGWLTQDGKKEGRRMSIRELSNQFRRPIEEIIRCLATVTAPEVDFIRIIDGQHEWTTSTAQEPSEDTSVSVEPKNGSETGTDTSGIPDGYSTISDEADERKNERSKPPIVPQGGQETDSDQSTETGTPSIAQASSADTEEPLQYAEAERFLNSLFPGCHKHFGNEEMHWLSDHLPLPAVTCKLLQWAYTLPRDPDGWALYDGRRTSKPKQSRRSLLREFGAELDKWRTVRGQLGLNGSFAHEAAEERQDDGWTDARRQSAFELFGEQINFATPFEKLGNDIQRRIDKNVPVLP